ncbi:MAG: hypothetical protein ACLFR2_07395 [Candidatus Kapaibacterium sp.]
MKKVRITYELYIESLNKCVSYKQINLPKSRSSKIVQFKHYQTDAPI